MTPAVQAIKTAVLTLPLYQWSRVGDSEVFPFLCGGKRGKWLTRPARKS